MAAILNPTAHSAHPERSASLVDGSSPLAPWNRAEARQSLRPVRHLHLVAEPAPLSPVVRRRPVRILLAGLGLAALVAFAAIGVLPFLGADAAAVTPASSTDTISPAGADVSNASAPAAAPVVSAPESTSPVTVVVQQGDSLWSIARRLQPRGDLRHLVDRLIDRVGATSVTRGQHIDVRGLLD